MKRVCWSLFWCGVGAAVLGAQATAPVTEITKWPDGRQAAVAITYDDSTINQFRIALPLMNERKLVGRSSSSPARFRIGMPTLNRARHGDSRQGATVPTSGRTLRTDLMLVSGRDSAQRNRAGEPDAADRSAERRRALAKRARQEGLRHRLSVRPCVGEHSQTGRRPATQRPQLGRDRRVAAQGHEIANHAVSHAHDDSRQGQHPLWGENARELRDKMGEARSRSNRHAAFATSTHQVLICKADLVRKVTTWTPVWTATCAATTRRPSSTKPYWVGAGRWAARRRRRNAQLGGPVGQDRRLARARHPRHQRSRLRADSDADGDGLLRLHQSELDSGKVGGDLQDGAENSRAHARGSTEAERAGHRVVVTPLDARKYDVPLTCTAAGVWTSTVTQTGKSNRPCRKMQRRLRANMRHAERRRREDSSSGQCVRVNPLRIRIHEAAVTYADTLISRPACAAGGVAAAARAPAASACLRPARPGAGGGRAQDARDRGRLIDGGDERRQHSVHGRL